jgi:Cadherin cytoplasmic region
MSCYVVVCLTVCLIIFLIVFFVLRNRPEFLLDEPDKDIRENIVAYDEEGAGLYCISTFCATVRA